MHFFYAFLALIGMANALPTTCDANTEAKRATEQEHVAARTLGDTVGGLLDNLTGDLGVRQEPDDAERDVKTRRTLGDTVGGLLDDLTGDLGVRQESQGVEEREVKKARDLGDTVAGLLNDVTGLLGLGEKGGNNTSTRDVAN